MNDYGYLAIQFSMAIAAYLLIFRTYLHPWLREQTFEAAVMPFLIFHIFRYLGLALLVTGQVDPEVSRNALSIMAYGDLASGVCALIAVVAIVHGSRFIVPLVVLFSVVGIAAGVIVSDIGTMWFFLVTFAPVLLLSHIYIIARLIGHFRSRSMAVVS